MKLSNEGRSFTIVKVGIAVIIKYYSLLLKILRFIFSSFYLYRLLLYSLLLAISLIAASLVMLLLDQRSFKVWLLQLASDVQPVTLQDILNILLLHDLYSNYFLCFSSKLFIIFQRFLQEFYIKNSRQSNDRPTLISND